MGTTCCKKENEYFENVDTCENISDIRNYISNKIEKAELEQEEINTFLEDKNNIPKTVEIVGFTEEDLKKRVLYLDEMKNCLNEIEDLLKKHPNINFTDIKMSLKEFDSMYTWIYDDSKRYVDWLKIFKNFIENDGKN